jgi:diacylglycerol O-acyltransferase
MRRLAATDSLFLSFETSAIAMHVGALVLLDTRHSPAFSFDRVREKFEEHITRVPKLMWTLKQVPLSIDRPSWTDTADFDIDRHLQRVTVPLPGGPREIAEVVGRLFQQRLDRSRPLWRAWYLDGLPEGTGALYITNHHCLMDGTSNASIASVLFDLEPSPKPEPPQPFEGPGGRDPSDLEHLLRSVLNMFATPAKVPGFVGACARRVTELVPDLIAHGVPSLLKSPPPRTSFNHAISARRLVAFVSLPLDDFRFVRKRLDVTVNDLIVAVCSNALERYLQQIGEGVPERPFVVAVPVSMRPPDDDGALTNRVAAFPIPVATHATDPAAKVQAISWETERAKQLSARVMARRMPSVAEVAPPFVFGTAMRALATLFPVIPVIMNTMVSTIRGAPFPLYLAGARITGIYPTNVLAANMGLDFTTISSESRIDVGITVDPVLVPDPWIIADALPEALEELVCAARLR